MAHPKRKISKTRRDKRRTHDALTAKPYTLDPNTGQAVQYHRVCVDTGYYKGRQVMKGRLEDFS
jgi:large subunit ribosomal protein L32